MKFRKIKELDFLYEISNDGILRNVKSKRIIKGTKDDCGYWTIHIKNKALVAKYGNKKYRIHQLVMFAWGTPKPFDDAVIDHIDRNIYNNNINNLRWVSRKDNFQNSQYYEEGKFNNVLAPYQYPKKRVIMNGVEYESYSQASREMNLLLGDNKNYTDRMSRHNKYIKGFTFEYPTSDCID